MNRGDSIKELYYILMKNKLGNAKECRTLIKHGLIKVNNTVIKDYKYLVKINDIITYKEIDRKSVV